LTGRHIADSIGRDIMGGSMTVVDHTEVEQSMSLFHAVWLSRPGRWLEDDDLDHVIAAEIGGVCTFGESFGAEMALHEVARSMARIGLGPPEAEIVSFSGHREYRQSWREVGRSKWEGRP